MKLMIVLTFSLLIISGCAKPQTTGPNPQSSADSSGGTGSSGQTPNPGAPVPVPVPTSNPAPTPIPFPNLGVPVPTSNPAPTPIPFPNLGVPVPTSNSAPVPNPAPVPNTAPVPNPGAPATGANNPQEKIKNYLYTTKVSKKFVEIVFKDKKFETLPSDKVNPNDISFILVREENNRFGHVEIQDTIKNAKPSQRILFIRMISKSSTVHGTTDMTEFIGYAKKVNGYENADIDFIFITKKDLVNDLDKDELDIADKIIDKTYKK